MVSKRSILILMSLIAGLHFFNKENINASDSNIKVKKSLEEIANVYNNGEFSRAINEYKRLADSGDIEGYLNLALTFKDLGRYSMAIIVLNKTVSKFGNDSRTLSLLARLYYLNNQIDQAIVVLNKILEIKHDDFDAYLNLGLCYEDRFDDALAQRYYEKALSLNKNNVVVRLSLADLYYRKNNLTEAANQYKELSLIDASITNIQKVLAQVFFKLGKLEESLRIFQKIRFVEPENKLAESRINEISGRLGQEYFKKQREKIALQRQEKSVFVKPFPEVEKIIFVRVGLMKAENKVEFKCSVPFEIILKTQPIRIFTGLAQKNYLLSCNSEGKISLYIKDAGEIVINQGFLIKPLDPVGTITLFNVRFGQNNFWSKQKDSSYRGSIEINIIKNSLNVVNIVNLEEYLYGVVPAEMPANWPKQALAAQAIAARSEAMAKLGRHKDEGFDFCPEVHCQAYAGVEQETELSNQSVDETRGIIMFYNGRPIDVVYSSNCGGHTQDNIFGKAEGIPYLTGRVDSLEKEIMDFPLSPLELEYWLKEPPKGILCNLPEHSKNSNFRWVRIYTAEEINGMLNKIADFGEIKKIIVLIRQKSSHVSSIKIIGKRTSYVLEKELNIRQALGNLRSSMFKIEIKYGPDKKPKSFIFYGGGWGHGVGMCQSGAYGMASLRKDYKEILNHYYQGIELKKVY